jgi:Subtilase family
MTGTPLPSPKNGRKDRLKTKEETQIDALVASFRAEGTTVGVARLEDGSLDYLYVQGEMLVRDEYLEQVQELVRSTVADGFRYGVTLLVLDADNDVEDLPAVLNLIDERFGVGVATPNHILSVCPVAPCPASEPDGTPGDAPPDPGVCPGGGQGIMVFVPDTGLLADADAHPWLAGVSGELDPLPPPDSAGQVLIPMYTGHGTFVAGALRCMAPLCQVRVTRDFRVAGGISESELVKQLSQALGLMPDIISLSAGGTSRKDLPLLSFELFWRHYLNYKGLVMVAAAGNNATRRPFWPAAFPEVVSVGALASNWRGRAYFSDYGSWVDTYAPGEELINAYATGIYRYNEPPRIGEEQAFAGMARWSGTSFSTPLVAGLIASQMSRTGENGRQAAAGLLASARAQAIPGLGPVLLPGRC